MNPLKPLAIALAIIGCTFVGCSRTTPNSSSPAAAISPSTSNTGDVRSESLTEAQKIERLISAVESLADSVFLRNGNEHSAIDAANHLRQKLDAAAGKITTASQFIDLVASKSSITGQDYLIRFADGRSVPAGEYLRGELAKLRTDR